MNLTGISRVGSLEWRLNAIEALALSERDTERMTGDLIADHAKAALKLLRQSKRKSGGGGGGE